MFFLSEQKWQVFFLVAVSIFMSTLDSSIVNVALPFIMKQLKTDLVTIQWVVIAYLTIVSSLLLTFGRLSDIHGKKVVYISGFMIFTLGSLGCAAAGSAVVLIWARILQGTGASMLMACSPALIADAFPPAERGRALGMIGAVVAAGLTTGPVLGGVILDLFSWHFIFLINIPIGIGAVMAGCYILPGAKVSAAFKKEPMDWPGSLFLAILIAALVVLLSRLDAWGVISLKTGLLAIVFFMASAGFWINESRTEFPLLDLSLLKIRLFIFPVISAAILFASLFIIVFMMPFYLSYPLGMSPSKTGGIMIVPFLFLLVISPVAGVLYDRIGSLKLCASGMGLMGISLFSLAWLGPDASIPDIMIRMSLAGLGTAIFVSPNNTAIMNNVPISRRGIASGAVATARNLGMVIGVATAGLIFTISFSNLSGGGTLEQYTPRMASWFMGSFRKVMMAGVVLSIFGLIITFLRGKESGNE